MVTVGKDEMEETARDYGPILRRGLIDHLAKLQGAPLAVFIYIVLIADRKTFRASCSVREISEATGYSETWVKSALKFLSVSEDPEELPYIVNEGRTNPWQPTRYFVPKLSFARTPQEPKKKPGPIKGSGQVSDPLRDGDSGQVSDPLKDGIVGNSVDHGGQVSDPLEAPGLSDSGQVSDPLEAPGLSDSGQVSDPLEDDEGARSGQPSGQPCGQVSDPLRINIDSESTKDRIGEGDPIREGTCIGSSPPPPASHNPPGSEDTHFGYVATNRSRKRATELVTKVEELFAVYPFSNRQIGNGEAEKTKEELAAILRLLSVDEALEVVRERYAQRLKETKGVDRPTNLVWYMPALKDAFFKRDREKEDEERKRDEEKRRRRRESEEEPRAIADLVEEALSPEEKEAARARAAGKFREIKEMIKAKGEQQ
ncbi:MAG: hypothetical protein SWK76_17115 [Actinomycetota bacterium]|nr:hypothetical protein [Actinomycetota bacterium]